MASGLFRKINIMNMGFREIVKPLKIRDFAIFKVPRESLSKFKMPESAFLLSNNTGVFFRFNIHARHCLCIKVKANPKRSGGAMIIHSIS